MKKRERVREDVSVLTPSRIRRKKKNEHGYENEEIKRSKGEKNT